jgi:DNA-binding CsgD family transcriptional regulator
VEVAGHRELEVRRLVRLLSATRGIQVVGVQVGGRAPSAVSPRQSAALVVSLYEPRDEVLQAAAGTALHGLHSVPEVRRPDLSSRQVDVLTAYGDSSALLEVVARGLAMTPETVKTHLRRIRAKYAAVGRPAPTRRDLYVRAIEDGFLPPPG